MAYVSISFGDVVSMETMSISNPDYKQAVLKMTDNAGNNLGIHMPPALATAIAEVFTAHQAVDALHKRAREMNAELTANVRDVMQAKGMI